MSELLTVTAPMEHTWRYASGNAMETFCAGLKEQRIRALRCPGCGRRYLPPRPVCGNCHVRLHEWVPVSDEGTLEAWTIVHLPMLDGRTGRKRPSPYGMGLIRLDGADTTLNHYLADGNPEHLRIGARVEAVWRDDLRGAMDDILHFMVIA